MRRCKFCHIPASEGYIGCITTEHQFEEEQMSRSLQDRAKDPQVGDVVRMIGGGTEYEVVSVDYRGVLRPISVKRTGVRNSWGDHDVSYIMLGQSVWADLVQFGGAS